jgi:hypothetical protein
LGASWKSVIMVKVVVVCVRMTALFCFLSDFVVASVLEFACCHCPSRHSVSVHPLLAGCAWSVGRVLFVCNRSFADFVCLASCSGEASGGRSRDDTAPLGPGTGLFRFLCCVVIRLSSALHDVSPFVSPFSLCLFVSCRSVLRPTVSIDLVAPNVFCK